MQLSSICKSPRVGRSECAWVPLSLAEKWDLDTAASASDCSRLDDRGDLETLLAGIPSHILLLLTIEVGADLKYIVVVLV